MATATPATLPVPTRMAIVVQKDAKEDTPDSESLESRIRFHISTKRTNWNPLRAKVKHTPEPMMTTSMGRPHKKPLAVPIKFANIKYFPSLVIYSVRKSSGVGLQEKLHFGLHKKNIFHGGVHLKIWHTLPVVTSFPPVWICQAFPPFADRMHNQLLVEIAIASKLVKNIFSRTALTVELEFLT